MIRITEKAMLVNLAISQWTARKLDKRETQEVAVRNGTAQEVARVNKALLPFAKPLDLIHKKTGEIRSYVYAQTVPWAIDGSRALTVENYLPFTAQVRTKMDEWHALAEDFLRQYPNLQQQARGLLNGMYRDEDYPPIDVVRRKFTCDIRFFPIPTENDWRVLLDDEQCEALKADLLDSLRAGEMAASKDCWKRLYDVVKHASAALGDPKAIFRDSLVENAKELCSLLPRLNITDDPNLEKLRQEVEGSLCAHTPEVLRVASVTRAETAAKMADVLAKMGAFYGA